MNDISFNIDNQLLYVTSNDGHLYIVNLKKRSETEVDEDGNILDGQDNDDNDLDANPDDDDMAEA